MFRRTTSLGTFRLDLHWSGSADKVVLSHRPLCGEGSPVGWWISLTEIGVMNTRDVRHYWPQELRQLLLVHSLHPTLPLRLHIMSVSRFCSSSSLTLATSWPIASVTTALSPVSSLAPHIPPRISVPWWGLSLITWKVRPVSSQSSTAACSLVVSLLSRSRDTTTSTLGSSRGRNLHTIPNIPERSPSWGRESTGQRSNLGQVVSEERGDWDAHTELEHCRLHSLSPASALSLSLLTWSLTTQPG